MNPDLNVQYTTNVAGILFNQIVSLVVWFFQNYGVDFMWLTAITFICLSLLAGLKLLNLV